MLRKEGVPVRSVLQHEPSGAGTGRCCGGSVLSGAARKGGVGVQLFPLAQGGTCRGRRIGPARLFGFRFLCCVCVCARMKDTQHACPCAGGTGRYGRAAGQPHRRAQNGNVPVRTGRRVRSCCAGSIAALLLSAVFIMSAKKVMVDVG